MANAIDYTNSINNADLDTIYLTGAGYVNRPFKGISRESAWGWEEPTWGGDLTRSSDFVMTNIDEVDFGKVARCEISYKYMNNDDYFALRKIAKERHCVANFYNRDTGERVTQEMAFTKSEMEKLYKFGVDLLGCTNIKVSMVATNRDKVDLIKSLCTISYNNNGGTGSISNQSAIWSNNITLVDGTAFTKTGYNLKEFNTASDGSGWSYLPNQSITVFNDLTLYAIWE